MGELAKIESFRTEIAIAETIEEVKLLSTKGDIMAAMAKKLDIPLKGQNELGRTRVELVKKLREVIEVMFPRGGNKGNQYQKVPKSENTTLANTNITRDQSSDAKLIKEESELVEKVMDEIEKCNEVITPKKVAREIRRRKIIIKQKEKFKVLKDKELTPLTGKFDVIVIDPPWQMEKIKRDVAPLQIGFDYPTMTIDEIKKYSLPAENNCHIFIWITHKHLPEGFDIFKEWNVNYICCFVWHKNGGFQPFGLPQYNCEFALYGRIGTPSFIDLKDFNVCFNAARTGHSEKPEEFYKTLKRVTVGRRVDIFNRRNIKGFDKWGNET